MSTLAPIEISNGPKTTELIKKIINFSPDEKSFIGGESFSFPHLKPKFGLKFISSEALESSCDDDDDDDDNKDEDDEMIDFDLMINLDVQASAKVYGCDKNSNKIMSKDAEKKLKENVNKWIVVCEDDSEKGLQIKDIAVVDRKDDYFEVKIQVRCEYYFVENTVGPIISSSFKTDIWDVEMNKVITEGVCYSYNKVPSQLRNKLKQHIDVLAEKIPVDYHPNSNNVIRDLVHPALYSYIKGVSRLKQQVSVEDACNAHDFWGRKYEDSKFQWLPTPYCISNGGKCTISEYINNLNRDKFSFLYDDLQALFEIFLPYFEEVWSYVKAMKFWDPEFENDDLGSIEDIPMIEKSPVSFSGKDLLVITKIVEYKLNPGQAYEGVWHAEGMSHENIVMTGILFLDRDASLEGGSLKFKRAFQEAERVKVLYEVPQTRPVVFNEFASEGYLPLGNFPTDEGNMLVFPNCHIHKVSKLINTHETSSASRRIVVFFVVNPEKTIISTKDLPPQQNSISLRNAEKYRLELMKERKYDKEKLNVRDIELCEH